MSSAASVPFLRQRYFVQAGDTIANIRLTDEVCLYDRITDHLLLAVISTSCDDCLAALESLERFAQLYPKVNLIILAVTDKEGFDILHNAFDGMASVYRMPESVLVEELQIRGYPWAYGINSLGQIVTSDHCGQLRWIEGLMGPFNECMGVLQ